MSLKTKSKPAPGAFRTTQLSECVSLFEGPVAPRVDRASGIIHGVRILGKDSKNDGGNREYSDQAMNDACQLYEGMGVNLDHPAAHEPTRDRHFHEGIGQLRNVSRHGDGVYGDLHVLTEHPHSGMLFEAAERMPGRFGLSHNAEGDVRRDPSGKNIVTNLKKVRSVDVVHKPATNVSLFESHQPAPGARTVKTVKIKELFASNPELKPMLDLTYRTSVMEAAACMPPQFQAKVKEDADGGSMPGYEDADADVPDDAPSSGGDGMSAFVMSLLQMIVKLLGKSQVQERRMKESKFGPDEVEGQALEMPAGAYSQGGPGDGGAKGPGPVPKKDEKYQESLRETISAALAPLTKDITALRTELGAQKALTEAEKDRAACVALFESLNREPHEIVLKAALKLTGEDRKQLIESQPEKTKTLSRFPRPEVSRSLIETDQNAPSTITIPTGDAFKSEMFRGGSARRVVDAG